MHVYHYWYTCTDCTQVLGTSGFLKGLGGFLIDKAVAKKKLEIKCSINQVLQVAPVDSAPAVVDTAVTDAIEPQVRPNPHTRPHHH